MDLYAVMQEADEQDEQFMAILVDIEKAFDSVWWSFLLKVLCTFGIPEEFICWIQIIYNKNFGSSTKVICLILSSPLEAWHKDAGCHHSYLS